MPRFSSPATAGRAPRTRLGLEQLADRWAPSGLTADNTLLPDSQPTTAPLSQLVSAPIAGAMDTASDLVITGFAATELGSGWYAFHGQVTGPVVDGLTVTFGGIPSLQGQSATTTSSGMFWVYVQLKTDGTDSGTATSQTSYMGEESDVAMYDVTPTR
jgi:hypothetical protein